MKWKLKEKAEIEDKQIEEETDYTEEEKLNWDNDVNIIKNIENLRFKTPRGKELYNKIMETINNYFN